MLRSHHFIELLQLIQECQEMVVDPRQNPAKVSLKKEEILKWLGNGAQPSDTVKNILSREGVIKEFAESKKAK